SRFWQDGDHEIQRGYLPKLPGIPKGLKLQRGETDDANRVTQWLSAKGDTVVRQAVRKWGASADESAGIRGSALAVCDPGAANPCSRHADGRSGTCVTELLRHVPDR